MVRFRSSTPSDIPWFKLDVIARRGSGVSTVQRINTHGGVVKGLCGTPGSYYSVPYSADHVFLPRGRDWRFSPEDCAACSVDEVEDLLHRGDRTSTAIIALGRDV